MTEKPKPKPRGFQVAKNLTKEEGRRRIASKAHGTGDFRGVTYDPKTGKGLVI